MATRTFTAGANPAQPIVNVAGNITVSQKYVASVDATDVLIFERLKIPHGAIIEEVKLAAVAETASTTSLSLVLTAGLVNSSLTVQFGSATFSASWGTRNLLDNYSGAATTENSWPFTVSLSDDNPVRWTYARLLVDAFTGSVTGSRTVRFAMAITYHMQK